MKTFLLFLLLAASCSAQTFVLFALNDSTNVPIWNAHVYLSSTSGDNTIGNYRYFTFGHAETYWEFQPAPWNPAQLDAYLIGPHALIVTCMTKFNPAKHSVAYLLVWTEPNGANKCKITF